MTERLTGSVTEHSGMGTMGEVVVKHFRRSNISSDEKELITEIVVADSDTGQFLTRMEESRLTRPCFQTLDMRGRVAGECRPYAFNDRIHYLDDISFQIFEQGLHENNGVYTVGTFEAIINGPHTLKVREEAREAVKQHRAELEQRRLERARAAVLERARANDREADISEQDLLTLSLDNPDLLPLGYFRRRTHPRLQYACPVILERGNISCNGNTRDFSVCGAQVRIKGLAAFKKGQEILVSFKGLPTERGKVDVERIAYQILGTNTLETETILRLRRIHQDKPEGFTQLVEDLIERHQRKYKLDVDDEYQSVLSWYYERCYAESAAQIPFYVEQADAGDPRVQAVAMSEGNSHLARFFCTDADNYNFTPLCLPQRLQRLQEGGSFVLAMYRQRTEQDQCMRIHSAADFECASSAQFGSFVQYALAQSEHCIAKVHVARLPVVTVSDKKVDEVSQKLQYKSEAQMVELRHRLQRLRLVAYVVDETNEFSNPLSYEAVTLDGECAAWVGTERRRLRDASVLEKLSMPVDYLRPELVRFGYVERRREDRYLADTRVDVLISGQKHKGMSKDISTRGMRIHLDDTVVVKKGATVKVGLVSLQKKKSSTNLMNIPYRVVNFRIEEGEDGTVLMLERILGGNQEGLKEFFVELITKNQHKLGVDIGDIWGATASRIYESLMAANTPSIPFFLARDVEGGAHLQYVGLPEAGGPLLDFFKVPDGYDFRCLNERRIVSALYDAVQILARQSKGSNERAVPFEMELYLYREYDEESGAVFIHSASELDFNSDTGREAFLTKLAGYSEWRCLKVVATFTQPLNEKSFGKMLEAVQLQSKHRAIKLSELAHSVVGYAELIDITEEWLSLR